MRTKQPFQVTPHACSPAGRFVLRADSFPVVSDCAPALSTCRVFRRQRPFYVPQRICGCMERKGLRPVGRRIAAFFPAVPCANRTLLRRKAAYRREGIRKRKSPPASLTAGREGCLYAAPELQDGTLAVLPGPGCAAPACSMIKKLNPPHAGHGPAV